MLRLSLSFLLASAAWGFASVRSPAAVLTTHDKHFVNYSLRALTKAAVAEGEREILDGPDGPVLVTKVAGNYYAVDATCPHLGLPMKKGKISNDGGTPTITCNFHNSCFELESGKCTQWVTGALGVKSGFVSGIMGKIGSGQKDLKAYTVTEQEDGSLLIE